jgi:hypothetical protein
VHSVYFGGFIGCDALWYASGVGLGPNGRGSFSENNLWVREFL